MNVSVLDGELLRFHVRSEDDPEVEYLVDLAECGGNGWCGCWDFEFRRFPAWKRERKASTDTRCKHLDAARAYLLDALILERLAAHESHSRFRRKPKVGSGFRIVRPMSAERREEMAEYLEKKGLFLKLNPICIFSGEQSEDVHHVRGRAGLLLGDTRYWLAVSRKVHDWIHANREQAIAKGLLGGAGKWLTREPEEMGECGSCRHEHFTSDLIRASDLIHTKALNYCLTCAKKMQVELAS